MSSLGKILGFLFGYMLTKHPVGALLGLWLGHKFDKGRGLNFNNLGGSQVSEASRQKNFFDTTFAVMGYMAKVNGHVSKEEIAFASAYMDKLGLSVELKKQAQDAFRDGKTVGFPLDDYLKEFMRICGHRKDLLLMFLEIEIQVAFADGELDASEREALHVIGKALGFATRDLDRLLDMITAGDAFHQENTRGGNAHSSPQKLANAYKLLGVASSASSQEIKKAYRKLMSQHHPDKLVAKGLPPEMMEIAKQKTQDIQAAYELVVKDKAK